jgi:hypothetical protein
MIIEEILKNESERKGLMLVRDRLFFQAWEYSAFLFVNHLRPYRIHRRIIKKVGEEVVWLGFPRSSLESVLADAKKLGAKACDEIVWMVKIIQSLLERRGNRNDLGKALDLGRSLRLHLRMLKDLQQLTVKSWAFLNQQLEGVFHLIWPEFRSTQTTGVLNKQKKSPLRFLVSLDGFCKRMPFPLCPAATTTAVRSTMLATSRTQV